MCAVGASWRDIAGRCVEVGLRGQGRMYDCGGGACVQLSGDGLEGEGCLEGLSTIPWWR